MVGESNSETAVVSFAGGSSGEGEAGASAASASYVRLQSAESSSGTRRYLYHAAICCLSCASADVGGSLFAPFFPAHAAERGLSSTLIGVIFALPMISMLLVTPLVPQLQRRCGVRLTLVVSMLAQAVCIFTFGFVDWLPRDPAAFSAVCLVSRAVLGVASAGSEVAATTILISAAPPRLRSQSLGWAEAARGLGSMLGPPLGGLLFEYGGFPFPFLVVGAANALLTLPLLRLPKASLEDLSPVSICAILQLPPALAGAAVVCGAMVAVGFLEPTLQPFLAAEPFCMSEAQTGLVFSFLTAAYIATSLVAGRLTRILGDEPQMLLGVALMGVGYIFVGPAPVFGSLFGGTARQGSPPSTSHGGFWGRVASLAPATGGRGLVDGGGGATIGGVSGGGVTTGGGGGRSVARVLLSLFSVGVGGGLAYVPTNSVSLRAAERRGISADQASAALAAIVNLSYCAGAAAGPLLGGVLVPQCGGFAPAAAAFGVGLLILPSLLLPLIYERVFADARRAIARRWPRRGGYGASGCAGCFCFGCCAIFGLCRRWRVDPGTGALLMTSGGEPGRHDTGGDLQGNGLPEHGLSCKPIPGLVGPTAPHAGAASSRSGGAPWGGGAAAPSSSSVTPRPSHAARAPGAGPAMEAGGRTLPPLLAVCEEDPSARVGGAGDAATDGARRAWAQYIRARLGPPPPARSPGSRG